MGQLVISRQYDMINYLPFMYDDPSILGSARPKPIVTYDSIVYPFDLQVWSFTFACIMTVLIIASDAICVV